MGSKKNPVLGGLKTAHKKRNSQGSMVLTQVEIGAPPLLINFGGILQGPFCHRWQH
jgi:hypothetical protein